MLIVRCKEIKMHVHVINVLIIIKIIVTREVISFSFKKEKPLNLIFFLLEQMSIFAAHKGESFMGCIVTFTADMLDPSAWTLIWRRVFTKYTQG